MQVYRTRFSTNAPLTIETDLRRGAAPNRTVAGPQ
jgi:hypothetical protein